MTSNEYDEDFISSKKELKLERKIASKKDRSKFKKTDLEKASRKEKKLNYEHLKKGRVLAIDPKTITVEADSIRFLCVLSGAMKQEFKRIKNLVAIGDFAWFDPKKNLIVSIDPRYSVLSRKDHLRGRSEQLIAANIDLVLITTSIASPPIKPALIDRYIIAAKKGNMAPAILVNKIDLMEKGSEEEDFFHLFKKTYAHLDIPVIGLSVITEEGFSQLQRLMKNRASVFSGQSGVGKTSLINRLTGLEMATGEIVKKTQKGSHTTTAASLIPLSFGGWCVDTPGIRSFGIWDLKLEDLSITFREIDALKDQCRYPNCTHTHEPGCSIQQALADGTVAHFRYDSYTKLLEELKELKNFSF